VTSGMTDEPYIYAPDGASCDRLVVIGEEAAHLAKVLRAGTGFRFVAFNGNGRGWLAETTNVRAQRVEARLLEELASEPVPAVSLTVAVGIVKGARMDWAVEKAAELGARRFIPLLTRYSAVQPGEGKLARWRSIAVAAAKQSRRFSLMEVASPCRLAEFLSAAKIMITWIFDADDSAEPFCNKVASQLSHNELTVVIGPEGGFSDDERETMNRYSLTRIRLGSHPLRTETAVTVTLGLLNNPIVAREAV